MNPYYSLIVLAYNNWTFTKQCLLSLLESLEEAHIIRGVEIILVDNGSNKETQQQMNAFCKKHKHKAVKLELLILKENLGYPSGINHGIEHSKGQIIGVLNNDLLFPPNWLTPIVNLLESDRSVGFAAPFLSYAGVSVQNVGKTFDTIEEMEAFAAYFINLNKSHVIYAEQIVGACLIFRRDLLTTIGGNDFWYGIGNFDDVDWCIRARLAGYKIAVVGGSFVHHIGHASFLLIADQFTSSLQINQAKFERKWGINAHLIDPKYKASTLKFEQNKHYIPLQISELALFNTPLYPRTSSAKRLFICADWSNPFSQWIRVFNSLLAERRDTELFCWVPATMYETEVITAQFQEMQIAHEQKFAATTNTLIVIHEQIPYSATLSLLRSTDEVVSIPKDYVNRYIIHLAEQAGMKII